MAIKVSTGHRNANAARNSRAKTLMTGTTISFGDGTGTGSTDQILDSGSGLAGFVVGDWITVEGSTSNDGYYKIVAVAAGAVDVAAGSLTTEAAGDQVILASSENGGSIDELYRNCVLEFWSGTVPTTADAAENGTMVCRFTVASGAFTPGTATNGLNLDEAAIASGVIAKDSAVWSGVNAATATVNYWRMYDNAYTTGASTEAIRIQGTIGVTGADITGPAVSLNIGETTILQTFSITLPASA